VKESAYNVYLLDEKEKKGLVFNTMKRSIVQIDDEVYNLIRDDHIDRIDQDVLDVLKKGNIVVDDNLDELDILKIMFCRIKFSTSTIGFTLIPTHACNLACKYCYQGHGEVLHGTMSQDVIKKAIEFIKKSAGGRRQLGVNFYGGEPLLHPEVIFQVLKEVKAFADENGMQFSVTFTSNGTLFTREIVDKLRDYNWEVQITLCGPQAVHDTIRVDKKGEGTYEKLMDVISLFRENEVKFHIRVDVDLDNYDTIKSLLEDLKKRGFEGIYMGFCPIGKDICYTEMERESPEIDPASLARLSKLAHDMGFLTNPIYIHNFVEGCSALMDGFLAIDPQGDVYKCIAAPNYTEHRIGTLDAEGNLSDMNYESYCAWTLRDPLHIDECKECKFSPICGGGCALAAYSKNGSLLSPGCKEEELGEVVRTYIMLKYPELFEGCRYETIVL
jgi:uncharacterized protein